MGEGIELLSAGSSGSTYFVRSDKRKVIEERNLKDGSLVDTINWDDILR